VHYIELMSNELTGRRLYISAIKGYTALLRYVALVVFRCLLPIIIVVATICIATTNRQRNTHTHTPHTGLRRNTPIRITSVAIASAASTPSR
jgi:hypothetical protein